MLLCKDCIQGVRHEDTPKGELPVSHLAKFDKWHAGKFEEVGGVRCYVATPTVDYPKDKVLLFPTDIFGINFVNNQASPPNPSWHCECS